MQWAPLNRISDIGINRFMSSTVWQYYSHPPGGEGESESRIPPKNISKKVTHYNTIKHKNRGHLDVITTPSLPLRPPPPQKICQKISRICNRCIINDHIKRAPCFKEFSYKYVKELTTFM
jgi:hypothetical protein